MNTKMYIYAVVRVVLFLVIYKIVGRTKIGYNESLISSADVRWLRIEERTILVHIDL